MINKTTTKGVLSVAAVALLLAVCISPIFVDEADAAADGTVYLRPGDSYNWEPTFNITDTERIGVLVGIVSAESASPSSYEASATLSNVTASVGSDKSVTVSAGDSASAGTTVYVKVQGSVTKGSPQTAVKTLAVKIVNPTISYSDVNTYPGGTVEMTPIIDTTGVSATVSYVLDSGSLPGGLSVEPTSGKIKGTVSDSATAGTYTGKVKGSFVAVGNESTKTQTFSGSYTIVVASSMSLADTADQYAAYGVKKDIEVKGTNIPTNASWTITSTSISGITMSKSTGSAGTITVANNVAVGEYDVTYSVKNLTSGQTVTGGTVKITVGSVSIGTITGSGVGKIEEDGTWYSLTGKDATFTVSATSNPTASGLGLTLSISDTDAGITVSGQTIKVASTVAAGTYTFTITETQASTGATASKNVSLTVDPVLVFTNAVTSGSLTLKGAS